MQLMELNIPIVLALNMMDELRGNGGSIRINEMEGFLGIPVIPIVAAKNEGVDELVGHALHIAQYQERPGRTDFCDKNDHGGAGPSLSARPSCTWLRTTQRQRASSLRFCCQPSY